MPVSSLYVCLLALALGISAVQRPTPFPATARDTTGLLRLAGTWVGNGTGPTGIIRDDGFAAEGYVWGSGPGVVELIETSTADPMRRFRGRQDERGLVVDEEPAERATRVRFDLLGIDSLRLQEINTRAQPPRAFVDEMFVRVGR